MKRLFYLLFGLFLLVAIGALLKVPRDLEWWRYLLGGIGLATVDELIERVFPG